MPEIWHHDITLPDALRDDLASLLAEALLEDLKTMPFGAVWDYYCLQKQIVIGEAWLAEIRRYEQDVLAMRC